MKKYTIAQTIYYEYEVLADDEKEAIKQFYEMIQQYQCEGDLINISNSIIGIDDKIVDIPID